MDSIYRGQKYIYDFTRKYYLFGRDHLIRGLDCQPGERVLEVACGTGRNLAKVGHAYPGTKLFGIDISAEMLKSAAGKLGTSAILAPGDARDFDARAMLGRETFDRVILSYSVSMIPDWEKALRHAATLVAPGGSLHVVDFGSYSARPGLLPRLLRWWLRQFHVSPRLNLPDVAAELAAQPGWSREGRDGMGGYYRLERLFREAPQAA
ncbi:MAG: SAM-dependent methyltransferase [Citromicrobium sp.]|nr:SAM-dependent methyltransferase [Citromicrobium sp.]